MPPGTKNDTSAFEDFVNTEVPNRGMTIEIDEVHILHTSDPGKHASPVVLCGAETTSFWNVSALSKLPATCDACILLAFSEPDTVHSSELKEKFIPTGYSISGKIAIPIVGNDPDQEDS